MSPGTTAPIELACEPGPALGRLLEAASAGRPARRAAARILLVAAVLVGAHLALAAALLVIVAVGTGASWLNVNLELFAAHPRLAVAAAGGALGGLLVAAAGFGAALATRRGPRASIPEVVRIDDTRAPGWAWTRPLLELLAYVAACLATTWPLVRDIKDRLIGAGDAQYYVWLGWRVGRLIASGQLLPTWIPDVVWPYGFDLRLGEGYLPMMVNGLWNLVAGPVAAYNLSLLTATGLNLWAGRRLGRLVSRRRLVWGLCAIAFATAPSLAVRLLGHHSLYFAFPTALVVEEAARCCAGNGRVRWRRLGLLWFLCYLCATYYLVGSAISFVVMCLARCVQQRTGARSLAAICSALALTAVLITPFLLARVRFDRAERVAGRNLDFDVDYRTYSADGLSLVAQPTGSTIELPVAGALRSGFSDNIPESTVFPGFLLLTGLAAFSALHSRIRWPLLVAAVTLWSLTLGPDPLIAGHHVLTLRDGARVGWLPFHLLAKLPMLASLRTPGRFGLLLPALLTLALAVAADFALARAARRGRLLVGFGCVLLLVFNLVAPIRTSRLPFGPATRAGLAEAHRRALPNEAVLEVPTDCYGVLVGPSSALQIFHGQPAIGCQAQYLALPWWSGMKLYKESHAMAALRCHPERLGYASGPFPASARLEPGDLSRMRSDFGLRFLVLNKSQLAVPECAHLSESGLVALEGFDVVSEDDRWKVIDLQVRAGGLVP